MKTKQRQYIRTFLFEAALFLVLDSIFINVVTHDYSLKALLETLIRAMTNGAIVMFIWTRDWIRIRLGSNYEKINVDKLLEANEQIIYQSPAAYIKAYDRLDGKLTLTNRRLIFLSNRLTWGPDLIIPVDDIKEVRTRRFLGILPTGIKLYPKSGKKEKFKTNDWEDWLRVLKNHSQMVAIHEQP